MLNASQITPEIIEKARTVKDLAQKLFLDKMGGMGLDNNDILNHHNKLLITGEYYFWLDRFQILDTKDEQVGRDFLNAHLTRDSMGRVIRGLYNRHPREWGNVTEDDVVSWDEYNGVMFLAKAIGEPVLIQDVIQYGLQNGWCFNNHRPELRDFRYTRQFRDTAFYKVMAGYKPFIWSDIYMCLSHLHSSIKETSRTSGRIQIFYRLELMQNGSFLYTVINDLYQAKLERDYGERAVATTHDLFYPQQIDGNNHPLRQFAHLWEDAHGRK